MIIGDYGKISRVVIHPIRSDGVILQIQSVPRTKLCYRRYGSDVVLPSLLRILLLPIRPL